MKASIRAILGPALGVLTAVFVGAALIRLYGESPWHVFGTLLAGTWGNPYGLGQVLYKSTSLVLAALAVAIPLRAGLFNVGGEAQIVAGSLAMALVGAALPATSTAALALPICAIAGALGGAAVGGLAGFARARFGAHEVIVTLMLNFLVLLLVNYLVVPERLALPESLHTREIVAGAQIPRLSRLWPAFHGSAANLALVLAVLLAFGAHLIVFRTRFGFELRAVGFSAPAAETGGVDVGRVRTAALALGGALAGMVGANDVLGYNYYFEQGQSAGLGFVGIAVAILGRNHPAGIGVSALFFATLSQGGLAINALCPKEIVEVLQAVVILVVLVTTGVGQRWRPASA